MNDRKSVTIFVFYMGDATFTWSSNKQFIVTFSTWETEYVACTSCVCHFIWLRRLLKPTEIYMDNSSVIALAKNPIFHDRSKHIDTRFHYLRDCIANKEVEVKYAKTQHQVADIFTKSLKYDVFIKMRDVLGVMKKLNLRGDIESKLISEN